MELKENLDILSWHGVLGRKAHFKSQFKIVGYAFIAMVIPFILVMVERVRTFSTVLWFIGVGLSTVIGALYLCLSVVAYWKRIRDIRGTVTDEGWAALIYFGIIFICLTNQVAVALYVFPMTFFVWLKKGVATDSDAIKLESIYQRICREFQN